MERARAVRAVALFKPSAKGAEQRREARGADSPRAREGLGCGGRRALTLASLAFAESVLLRCMRSLRRGWGSGGRCFEWAVNVRKPECGDSGRRAEALASLAFAES
eukprot:15450686-Alexandrium_andersonii.AAC.1